MTLSWEQRIRQWEQDDAIERLECLQKAVAAIEGTEAEFSAGLRTYERRCNVNSPVAEERR